MNIHKFTHELPPGRRVEGEAGTGVDKAQQAKGIRGESEVQSAKSKFGKFTVDWIRMGSMKTPEGRNAFSVSREKYFSKLIGHSKEFTAQVRWDVAAKIAEEKTPNFENLSQHERNEIIGQYAEQLKGKGVSALLVHAKKEREAFLAANRPAIEAAIDTFQATMNAYYEKHPNNAVKPEKLFPAAGSSERKAFIKGFMESEYFDSAGGNVGKLTKHKVEMALAFYINGEKVKECDLGRDGDVILNRKLDENNAIEDLQSHFDGKAGVRIDPKRTEQLIDLWQKQAGPKKNPLDNKKEVREFILGAYKQGEKIVPRGEFSLPKKSNETLEHYKDRVDKAVEKNLKNNPAARIAYGDDQIKADLEQAVEGKERDLRKKYEKEVGSILENIKPKEGELMDRYSNRILSELKKFSGSDDLKQEVAAQAYKKLMEGYSQR